MAPTDNKPSLEVLQKLQLFRTTLVNFLHLDNFTEAVTDLYVRVLLEMRGEDSQRESTGGTADNYYVARIKGTQKGPTYSGFNADSATTDWLLVIELPPTFRSTENGNVVQLNSISNSPFKKIEYELWLNSFHANHNNFFSPPQLEFRIQVLEESKQRALTMLPRRRRYNNTHGNNAIDVNENAMNPEKKARLEKEICATYLQVPLHKQVNAMQTDELINTERLIFDLCVKIRQAIIEQSSCILCKAKKATEVCYPCKHQVLCKDCAGKVKDRCPLPQCNKPIESIFAPYTL